MSQDARDAVRHARKVAMAAMAKWMDAHMQYQLAHQDARAPEPPAKKAKKDKSARACAGNVAAGTACPQGARAGEKSVREGGKNHPVCDACRKAVNKYRRDQKKDKK